MTRINIKWLRNHWYVLKTDFSNVDVSQVEVFKGVLQGHGFEEFEADHWQVPEGDEEAPVNFWNSISRLPFETEMSPFFLPPALEKTVFENATLEWVRA